MRRLDVETLAGQAIGFAALFWDPAEEMTPWVLARQPDGGLAIVDLGRGFGGLDAVTKGRVLCEVLIEHEAVAAAVVAAGWAIDAEDKQPGLQVRDHQARREAIFALVDEGDGEPFSVAAPIVRDDDGLGRIGGWGTAQPTSGAMASALVEATRARREGRS